VQALGVILGDEGKEGHGMPPPNPRDGGGQRAEGAATHWRAVYYAPRNARVPSQVFSYVSPSHSR